MSLITISNVQYSSQYAGLFDPAGYVVGAQLESSGDNRFWEVEGDGDLFNHVTASYASVPTESSDQPVQGNPNGYTWQQISSGDIAQIVTKDGKLAWRLTGAENGKLIELRTLPYSGNDALWNVQTVPNGSISYF